MHGFLNELSFIVAIETQVRKLGFQQFADSRCMRIMTTGATHIERGMRMFPGKSCLVMASIAEIRLIG